MRYYLSLYVEYKLFLQKQSPAPANYHSSLANVEQLSCSKKVSFTVQYLHCLGGVVVPSLQICKTKTTND